MFIDFNDYPLFRGRHDPVGDGEVRIDLATNVAAPIAVTVHDYRGRTVVYERVGVVYCGEEYIGHSYWEVEATADDTTINLVLVANDPL